MLKSLLINEMECVIMFFDIPTDKEAEMFIVDSHCDSIGQVDGCRYGIVNPYNFSRKHLQLQFVAMFTGWEKDTVEDAWQRACRYVGQFYMSMASESDKIMRVTSYADVERAFSEGKHAAMLTLESATGLKGSPTLLEKFYNVGVRVVGLTWLSNCLAKSNRVFDDGEADTGISDIGRAFVRKGNELGIIWDVSHASDKTFWDLAELSKKPLVATHSNFRALCPHSRNLTDEMAKHIIDAGGMIGLNLYPPFIHKDKEKQTVDTLLLHLEHCLNLGGEDRVGLGCDIDGIDRLPTPLNFVSSIHDQLIDAMQKHYSERLVEKVSGGNYLSYLKKWL